MTDWWDPLGRQALGWLLEREPANPGPRFLALRDLLERPSDDEERQAAQRDVMAGGPVPAVLAAQRPEGWWEHPGAGYMPKYRSTVWSLSYLAQLGADGADSRVARAAEYVLSHGLNPLGAFAFEANSSMTLLCLNGNLGAALLDLGWGADLRLQGALECLARLVTGEGVAPTGEKTASLRYLKSATCGPGFCCSANNSLPCAWGAVKVMLALGKVPPAARSPLVQEAIQVGLGFLLGRDPAVADYPAGYSDKPSRSWFQFGFPVFYVTDVLQNLEALTTLGCAGDPRLAHALEWLRGKRDAAGRWKMEYSYAGKTHADVEAKGQPSKWVTLRALRVLRVLKRQAEADE
ncbi:MAG: nitrogen fixation protein NifH [Chloroflexi bacterium]|nr:nitrogen fixation protein NifH [Chloroflexota bacterium]